MCGRRPSKGVDTVVVQELKAVCEYYIIGTYVEMSNYKQHYNIKTRTPPQTFFKY